MVSNSVQVNEEVDPVMIVRRLKAEIVELKEEIALLRGGESAGDLDDAAQDKIRRETAAESRRKPFLPNFFYFIRPRPPLPAILNLASRHDVRAFVDDPSAQTLSVGANISAIRFAFSCLKGLVVESRSRPGAAAGGSGEDVAKLQLQLQQVSPPPFPPLRPPPPVHSL